MNSKENCIMKKDQQRLIDPYSYGLGVIDCFCEMVAAGLKTLAMSHPCDTREERDSYLEDVKRICGKYGIQYYMEDEALLTELFPVELNQGKFNYLFFRDSEVLEHYLELKKQQKRLIQDHKYTRQKSHETAAAFGRLLSYPEEGIERLIGKSGNM